MEKHVSKSDGAGEHTHHPSTAVGVVSHNSRNLFMTGYKHWEVIVVYFNSL